MNRATLFKLLASAVLLSVVMSACAPATPAAPPPPQVVKETVIVKEQVQVTVEKPVEKVVEKNVVVTATPPPPATAAPKPKGKISLWGWKAAMDVIRGGCLPEFQKEYPDIQVEIVEYSPTDVYQKLPLALSAGTGAPDVSLVENSHLAQFVSLGGLKDLTEKVQPYLDKMNKYKWNDAELDGKYYAMPWDSGPVVLYYRRDVFKNAGLPDDPEGVSKLIATWDDYLKACKTIKEKTGAECFSNNKANNLGRLYEMMLWQQGLGYYNAQNEVTVDSPENIATLEKMGEFWKEGLTSDQLEWTDGWYAELASLDKPIATIVEASWMGVFLKSWIAPGTGGKWGVALMPAMKAGQARAANDGGSTFVIPEQTQNPDAAWAFVEYCLGRDDSQLKLFALSDFIPSLETTYDDALFTEPDQFFGGQVARKVYSDVVKQVPTAYVYGPNYSMMNRYIMTAIQEYATGKKSAADALKGAATAIRQESGMN